MTLGPDPGLPAAVRTEGLKKSFGRQTALDGVDLHGLHPEAFFTPDDHDRVLLLSDDGTEPVGGLPCKRVANPSRKRFRGRWITVTAPQLRIGG